MDYCKEYGASLEPEKQEIILISINVDSVTECLV